MTRVSFFFVFCSKVNLLIYILLLNVYVYFYELLSMSLGIKLLILSRLLKHLQIKDKKKGSIERTLFDFIIKMFVLPDS